MVIELRLDDCILKGKKVSSTVHMNATNIFLVSQSTTGR